MHSKGPNELVVPCQPLTPDFGNGLILRSYMQTVRTFNYYNTNDTNGLIPDEFAHGCAIYAFDLTPHKEVNDAHRQAITSKNFHLELFF